MALDFMIVTDRFRELSVRHADIAQALGVGLQSIRATRLDPEAPNYRRPPKGWPRKLAQLARSRAAALLRLAEQLERED